MEKEIKRALVITVASSAGLYLTYKIFKLWLENKTTIDADKNLRETIKSIDESKLSISNADANTIAQRLYYAMKDVGTDEDEIEELLVGRSLNSEDIRLIVNAFGVKKYNSYGSPMFDWLGGDDMTLMEWLKRETSGDLLDILRVKFTQAGFVF